MQATPPVLERLFGRPVDRHVIRDQDGEPVYVYYEDPPPPKTEEVP